jgi:hypothetical protein
MRCAESLSSPVGRIVRWASAGVAVAALAIAMGCGGGGGGRSQLNVTRGNAPSFTEDALILAARQADGPWLSADLAGEIDTDIQRIRQQYPQVTDVHALPDFVLNQLIVACETDAAWLPAWRSGTMHTGVAELDALLVEFDCVRVEPLTPWTESDTFILHFAQPLNTRALEARFEAASPSIRHASDNGIIGDSDRIDLDQSSGKKYTFSAGWGDCPAGCTGRHYWEFTLNGDGSITLREYGADLSQRDDGRAAVGRTYWPRSEAPDGANNLTKR